MLRVAIRKTLGERTGNLFTLDVDLEIGDGITMLVGASGAGKTTTLRLIAGIITPDRGRIMIGERVFFDSATGVNLPVQRRRIGFVFQDYALFPHLTAEQNVAYGITAEDQRARRDRACELLEIFRVSHTAKRRPSELSGGEQQRVALARALAINPQAVLLDEPLSAVDVETRAHLLDEIEAAQRRARIPFVYVTHNTAEAERLGSRIVVLRGGRVIEEKNIR